MIHRFTPLWPDWLVHALLNNTRIPCGRRLFHYGPGRWSLLRHRWHIRRDDVAWIHGSSTFLPETHCRFERFVKRQGSAYVFRMEDNWFDCHLSGVASAHIALADLVAVSTPQLLAVVRDRCPAAQVDLFEEPVDVDRLQPVSALPSSVPVVLWSGRANNIADLQDLAPLLCDIYHRTPFSLRVVCGRTRPKLDLPVPWEWRAYDPNAESQNAAGVRMGIAPLPATTYNVGKGNYKVKTYMALGLAIVTAPVGYNLDLLQHEKTGFLAAKPEEWREAMLYLLDNEAAARQLGAGARAEACRKYSHAVLIPRWAETLRRRFPQLEPQPRVGIDVRAGNVSS